MNNSNPNVQLILMAASRNKIQGIQEEENKMPYQPGQGSRWQTAKLRDGQLNPKDCALR